MSVRKQSTRLTDLFAQSKQRIEAKEVEKQSVSTAAPSTLPPPPLPLPPPSAILPFASTSSTSSTSSVSSSHSHSQLPTQHASPIRKTQPQKRNLDEELLIEEQLLVLPPSSSSSASSSSSSSSSSLLLSSSVGAPATSAQISSSLPSTPTREPTQAIRASPAKPPRLPHASPLTSPSKKPRVSRQDVYDYEYAMNKGRLAFIDPAVDPLTLVTRPLPSSLSSSSSSFHPGPVSRSSSSPSSSSSNWTSHYTPSKSVADARHPAPQPPILEVMQPESKVETDPVMFLPEHLRHLYTHYAALETAFTFLHMRKQIATFSRLREAMERITKRRFEEPHLAQILFLFPDCFRVEMGTDELVILADEMPLKADRLDHFRIRLVAFFETQRSRFPTDAEVAVPEVPLPRKEEKKAYSYASFKEEVQKQLPKIESPIVRRVLQQKFGSPTREPQGPDLKGIAAHIVQKVRQKEVEKQMLLESGYVEKLQRRKDLNELVLLIDCVRSILMGDRKTSMMLEPLKDRVVASFKTTTTRDRVSELFALAVKELPEWCSLKKLSSGQCFIVNKSTDARIHDIKQSLTDKAEAERATD